MVDGAAVREVMVMPKIRYTPEEILQHLRTVELDTSTLAQRSPKTPRSREAATKPGSEKRARSDVGLCMR